VPRSAFLEGAREAGGTKTCSGAAAKQKTAVPKGAASLSLAVLESDGREREGALGSVVNWGEECAESKPHNTRRCSVRPNSTGHEENEGQKRPIGARIIRSAGRP
jgi:hypothetical protein